MLYPWYESIETSEELLQGDIIFSCPIVEPPSDLVTNSLGIVDAYQEFNVVLYNAIVMSQSCDLAGDKVTNVLVCPYHTLPGFLGCGF